MDRHRTLEIALWTLILVIMAAAVVGGVVVANELVAIGEAT